MQGVAEQSTQKIQEVAEGVGKLFGYLNDDDIGSNKKAERKTSKRGSILTYTNKTLKQHWEEYIGNEDPCKVLNEIYTPIMIKEREGHILCLPSNLPKKRVCLNKIRIREMNRQKTLILIRSKGSRRRGFLEHFLQQSLSLPFGYRANTVMSINKKEEGAPKKTDAKEQVKNAILVCCLKLFMIVCCVDLVEEIIEEEEEEVPERPEDSQIIVPPVPLPDPIDLVIKDRDQEEVPGTSANEG